MFVSMFGDGKEVELRVERDSDGSEARGGMSSEWESVARWFDRDCEV
jgi:hypothetical protein